MHLIDTHCHLDLYPDYPAVLAEIERDGIQTIAVTNAPSVFRRCAEVTKGASFVRAALGLHPELAVVRERELGLLDELLPLTRYIGELGLDYVTLDVEERATQRRVFGALLEKCAAFGDKVLSVHSRRAATDVVAMIGAEYPGTVILHWFSGPSSVRERAIECGCYFSVNSAMLASAAGRRTVSSMPPTQVLTETDGPFVAVRGRPARPPDVAYVLEGLGHIWRLDADAASRRVQNNFREALIRDPTRKSHAPPSTSEPQP